MSQANKYFAKVNGRGLVLEVMVATQSYMAKYKDKTPGKWIKVKKKAGENYPRIGDTYYKKEKLFLPPQPFPFWVINEQEAMWESPLGPHPGIEYAWDEQALEWVLIDTGE